MRNSSSLLVISSKFDVGTLSTLEIEQSDAEWNAESGMQSNCNWIKGINTKENSAFEYCNHDYSVYSTVLKCGRRVVLGNGYTNHIQSDGVAVKDDKGNLCMSYNDLRTHGSIGDYHSLECDSSSSTVEKHNDNYILSISTYGTVEEIVSESTVLKFLAEEDVVDAKLALDNLSKWHCVSEIANLSKFELQKKFYNTLELARVYRENGDSDTARKLTLGTI